METFAESVSCFVHYFEIAFHERGSGFEAWRLLVERYDGANASRLQSTMRPQAFTQHAGGFEVAFNGVGTPRATLGDLGQRPPERRS